MARKKVDVLINVIQMADTELIACKSIISQNYASSFTVACDYLSAKIVQLHVGSHMEVQRYKQWILEVSHSNGGSGGGRGCGIWMRGGRGGAGRGE